MHALAAEAEAAEVREARAAAELQARTLEAGSAALSALGKRLADSAADLQGIASIRLRVDGEGAQRALVLTVLKLPTWVSRPFAEVRISAFIPAGDESTAKFNLWDRLSGHLLQGAATSDQVIEFLEQLCALIVNRKVPAWRLPEWYIEAGRLAGWLVGAAVWFISILGAGWIGFFVGFPVAWVARIASRAFWLPIAVAAFLWWAKTH